MCTTNRVLYLVRGSINICFVLPAFLNYPCNLPPRITLHNPEYTVFAAKLNICNGRKIHQLFKSTVVTERYHCPVAFTTLLLYHVGYCRFPQRTAVIYPNSKYFYWNTCVSWEVEIQFLITRCIKIMLQSLRGYDSWLCHSLRNIKCYI